MEVRRNDIVFVKCNAMVPNGSVQCFDRPAIVLQNNKGNANSPTLIVAYLTSQIKRTDLPTHVVLQHYPGLCKKSMVLLEQVDTISKDDVVEVINHLDTEDVVKVNNGLLISLGFGEVA